MRKKRLLCQDKGQSLVEFAITLPILLLMLIGLVEVGAALRNYLVVVNANREGTRFAARGRWFNGSEQEIFKRVVAAGGDERYEGEWVRILRTVDQGDLEANTGVYVTYIAVPHQMDAQHQGYSYTTWFTGTLPDGGSRIDPDALGVAAAIANQEFNQQYYVNGDLDMPSEDNFVVVEVWYQHEQWLKMPIFTELLPERFTLYAQSTMRVTLGDDSRYQ